MGFNGKSLILVGAILFIFQIANFISIETITPELERAQVLAAIASLIIILIGFLFKLLISFAYVVEGVRIKIKPVKISEIIYLLMIRFIFEGFDQLYIKNHMFE